VTPRAIATLFIDLALVGLCACNGARTSVSEHRVPAYVQPASTGVGGVAGGSTVVVLGGSGGAVASNPSSTETGGAATSTGSAAGATGLGGAAAIGGATVNGGGSSETRAGSSGILDAGGDASSDAATGIELNGAPLVSAPTKAGFTLNAAVARGNPQALVARIRAQGSQSWQSATGPSLPAPDIAQWTFTGLQAGQRHEYQLIDVEQAGTVLYSGSMITQRDPGEGFTFAVLTDSHIEPPDAVYTGGYPEQTLRAVARDVGSAQPDFLINMGDMLDFHYFGFNAAPATKAFARSAYLRYRKAFGDTLGNTAHFAVVGNWEGEDGFHSAEEIDRSRSQRLLYLPGPTPTTYPQSGSGAQDYYAFTWGDALFVVLNVVTYTLTPHLLSSNPGVPDDWTLGAAQMAWLRQTLENATSKWRFLFIHHTVGGAAGDFDNSAYGRGGGQAARVGEQSVVHDLMLAHGVQIFFYGHDHVFTDMVVDGIHYTLPGSSGAPWKFTASETGYTTFWTESGFGRVEVGPAAVNVQFVAAGGGVIHEYRLQ